MMPSESKSPCDLVALVLAYQLGVKDSIPAASMIFFSAGFAGAHDILYSKLLAGICPAK
jgi:hypothetical protein